MRYFDYETTARDARIDPDKLEALRLICRKQFPGDEMMSELHLLRICRAISEGRCSIDDVSAETPATTDPRDKAAWDRCLVG